MSNNVDKNVNLASDKVARCLNSQIRNLKYCLGNKKLKENYLNIVYPPGLGYIFGLLDGAIKEYNISKEYFNDILSSVCLKIEYMDLDSKIDYLGTVIDLEPHSENDIFFKSGRQCGRKEMNRFFEGGSHYNLEVYVARCTRKWFPMKFNNNPSRVFNITSSDLSRPAVSYVMRGRDTKKIQNKILNGRNIIEVVEDHFSDERSFGVIYYHAIRLSDFRDREKHRKCLNTTYTIGPSYKTTKDRVFERISNMKDRVLYGSKKEIRSNILEFLNHKPANKKTIARSIFGVNKINEKQKDIVDNQIDNLLHRREIRKYDNSKYVSFGYNT